MNKKRRDLLTFILFVTPALFFFLIVQIIPFLIGIFYSFTDWSPAKVSVNVIGFQNYIYALSSKQFMYSFFITGVYTLGTMLVVNVFALSFAMLVTRNLKFRNLYRANFFVPNLIGGLVLGFLWQFIFNKFIPPMMMGMFGGTNDQYLFLGQTIPKAMIALITVGSWQYIGYIMVIYVAALQNVPGDLIEAAQIDGASTWQRFRSITIPMIAPAFTITLFLTLANSFKQYDINYALTNGRPAMSPEVTGGTRFIALDIVSTFNTSVQGEGASVAQAKAIIFFLILVGVSIAQVVVNKRREVEM